MGHIAREDEEVISFPLFYSVFSIVRIFREVIQYYP